MLETRRRSRQRSDRLRFHPRIRRDNDDGRIRKASGGRPKALYGMPEVQRDLELGRTPTSSRLQAFRIPSLKGLTSRGDSRFSYAEKCDPIRVKSSPFFELAVACVRLDHIARVIENANHSMMCSAKKKRKAGGCIARLHGLQLLIH